MSSSDTPKKILLKSPFGRYDEYRAAGAITPGHLVTTNSDGKAAVHNSAGGHGVPTFAIEDSLQGRTIDDAYAADDLVRVWHFLPGDVVYAWLADGESVSDGDVLESAGDGTLRAALGTAEGGLLFKAVEDVDLTTGTATANGRIRVQVLN